MKALKKFLLPIINLVNLVLVCITFGLGGESAYSTVKVSTSVAEQDWYSLVWTKVEDGNNTIGIVGFFLFILVAAAVLVAFVPTFFRKWVNAGVGVTSIVTGIFFLLTPNVRNASGRGIELSDSLIAMAVLMFIVALFALGMAAIEIVPMFTKKESK